MKSDIKRALFVGMSLAFVALAARSSRQQSQIEADVDPDAGPSLPPPIPVTPTPLGMGAPVPILGDQAARMPPRRPAASVVLSMVAAPTVTFSGTVVRSGPSFALRETAGVLYPLDFAGRALPLEGEDVRITGKLDLDTRLLYVDDIEPAVP